MQRTWNWTQLGFAVAVAAAGCADGEGAGADAAAGADGAGADGVASGAVTFWEDAAPILWERCVKCHGDGGVAPFRLDDYAEAKAWAGAIKVATANRSMPPWSAVDDGSCGTFAHSEWLTDAELATLAAWADGGAPEGDPSRAPAAFEPLPSIEDGDEYMLPAPYAPQGGLLASAPLDDYRCFALSTPATRSRFATAFEVLPEDKRIAHHALVFAVNPAGVGRHPQGGFKPNGEIMQFLDDQSPDQLGWPCYGAVGEGVNPTGLVGTWAPGLGAVEFPEGAGVEVRAGEILVVQMHYNLLNTQGEAVQDRTRFRVRFADEVPYPIKIALPDPFLFGFFLGRPEPLAPGQPAIDYTWEESLDDTYNSIGVETPVPSALDLLGVVPHMHRRGTKMRLEIVHADGTTCATQIDHWDFNWQRMYSFAEPMPVDPTDRFRLTCTYDTSEDTEPVMPGLGTENEMCMVGLVFRDLSGAPAP